MKKIVLTTIALLFSQACMAADTVYSQSQFSGFADQYFADDIGTTNASSMLNVWLDEYTGAITKRQGVQADNITPLIGNLWVRNLYDYKKIDGTEYRVAQSSNSVSVTNGNGNYTAILTGQDSLSRFDFTTAKNTLYGCNGYVVFKSTGIGSQLSTVYSSTGVPTGATLMKWINNRMYYSGIAATPSIIWYSELNDPDNVQPLNYLNINVSDGDSITGLFGFGLTPFVTKKFSTWQFPETSVNVFQVRPVSLTIGCLYQSTMQTYLGQYPMWLSSRGVEMYDGQFEPVSLPINNTILSLRQMNTQQSILTQDTAADWGAGSGTNIDTTTYPGSVAMVGAGGYSVNGTSTTAAILSFCLPYAMTTTSASLYCDLHGFGNSTVTWNFKNSSGTILFTGTFNVGQTGSYHRNYTNTVAMAAGFLQANSTYTWECTGIATIGPTTATIYGSSITLASFATRPLLAASWGRWSSFSVNDTVPTGSAITYQVVTATSAEMLSVNSPVSILNGGSISSQVGPYISITSSLTRTDASATPMINSYKIIYFGNSNMVPCSAIYKDRYYLAVSTNNTTAVNDTLLVFDKNQQWTRHSGNYGSMCVYRQALYHGDSVVGQVYADDIANLFTDNGVAYDSYYATKIFDYREQDATSSLLLKDFMEFWTRMYANAPGTINVNYRIDGSQGGWTTLAPMTYNAGLNVNKLQFPSYPKSKMIQYMCDDNYGTNYFNIKGLFSVYQIEPRQ